ncbi:MAG: iron-sulfur cluster assembly scaffold protein, partial [Burkholderiales bacterium]|nr:iron-sulfur cluster assembly scaffold protein [Opitutaceae bacterium]
MDASAEFYQAVIDDHRRRPRHRGPLPTANRVARRENPACGDLCTMQLEVTGDRILAAAFTGAGCALSQASASLATSALRQRTVTEARTLAAAVDTLIRTGATSPFGPAPADFGDLAASAARSPPTPSLP